MGTLVTLLSKVKEPAVTEEQIAIYRTLDPKGVQRTYRRGANTQGYGGWADLCALH